MRNVMAKDSMRKYIKNTIIGKHEKGYQAMPEDKGNYVEGDLVGTKYGISAPTLQKHLGKKPTADDMKNLNLETAIDILENKYYKKPGIDKLPESIRKNVLDMSINAGPDRAIKLLQKQIGAKQDGIIGPETINKSSKINTNSYVDTRKQYYESLAKRRPKNQKFLKGWLRRAESFRQEEPMAKEKKKKEEQPSLLGPLRQEEPKVADKEIAMVMQDVIPKDDPVAAQTMRNNLLVEGDQEQTTSGAPVSPGEVLKEKIGTDLQEKKEEAERKPASIEQRQEEENKRFQLSQSMKDALSYFGPRMGALLLGGVNAMEMTDEIMSGFESQQRGRTQDRQRAQQLEQQDQMTPYQQEQLRLREEGLDLRRQALDSSQKAEQEAVQLTEKQQDTLDKIDDTLGSMSTARQFLNKGNLTGFFDNYVRGAADTFSGNPRAYGRKVLEKLRVDDALIRIGQTKGAISDKEMGLFLSPAPTLNDQEDVWLKWINEREAAAKKIRERIKTGKRAENPATDNQVNSFTGSSSQDNDDALVNKYL